MSYPFPNAKGLLLWKTLVRRTWRIIFDTVQNAKTPHHAGLENTAIKHFKINITKMQSSCPILQYPEPQFHLIEATVRDIIIVMGRR